MLLHIIQTQCGKLEISPQSDIHNDRLQSDLSWCMKSKNICLSENVMCNGRVDKLIRF